MNVTLALNELRRACQVSINNAPLHELAGDFEQAELCRDVCQQCKKAIEILEDWYHKKLTQ